MKQQPVKRLYRSRSDRVLGGVCGGIAQYFGVDPVVVRLIFVLLLFAGGASIIVYLLAWIIVPLDPSQKAPASRRPGSSWIIGLLLILFGLLLFTRTFFHWMMFSSFLGVLLLILGIYMLLLPKKMA